MLMHGNLSIFILSGLIFIFLLYLGVENHTHRRLLQKIPIRISVTGTRGKTSTVRLIASVLRESGYRVLAKTTGSEPNYILPDGRDEPVRRRGQANILEQKKLVQKAVKLEVDFLVCETMSIQPENHWVESQKLIKPHYTVLTNLRPDHLDHYPNGNMSDMLINDLYKESVLVAPIEELSEELISQIENLGVRFLGCRHAESYVQNEELALALAAELSLPDASAKLGIQKAKMDIGQFEEYPIHTDAGHIVFVNSFAANDPLSSELQIKELLDKYPSEGYDIIGLFSLRKDRGERSQQWLNYLKEGASDYFDEMYFMGIHSDVLIRKLGKGQQIRTKSAEAISSELVSGCKRATIVIGLVNIAGLGTDLVRHWKEISSDNTNIKLT